MCVCVSKIPLTSTFMSLQKIVVEKLQMDVGTIHVIFCVSIFYGCVVLKDLFMFGR